MSVVGRAARMVDDRDRRTLSQNVRDREGFAAPPELSLEPRRGGLTFGTRSINSCELRSSTLLWSSLIQETCPPNRAPICCFTSKVELQIRSLI